MLLSKAGTFTETRPDGTVVTYEMEVEEFEEEVSLITLLEVFFSKLLSTISIS